MEKIIKTYRFKLRLNKPQEEIFKRWLGVCRTVYNLSKEVAEDNYKKLGKTLSAYDLQAQVIDMKRDYEWMRELPKDTLTEPAFRFIKSRTDSFRRKHGFPGWAKKEKYRTLVFCQANKTGLRVDGDKIHFHKMGWIKCFGMRHIEGEIKQILVTKKYNGWFASLRVETIPSKLARNNNHIGIDVGIEYLAVTSAGEFIENMRVLKQYEKQMRILQRAFARKKRGSRGWYESKKRIQKLYDKIKNTREDYLHKVTTQLVNENQVITVEDLNIEKMLKNKYLAKSIGDASWGRMIEMLEYKCEWYGRTFNKVPPEYTSRDCNICGHRMDKMPLHVREWTCPECLTLHNRDSNAAENIKQRGGQLLVSRT